MRWEGEFRLRWCSRQWSSRRQLWGSRQRGRHDGVADTLLLWRDVEDIVALLAMSPFRALIHCSRSSMSVSPLSSPLANVALPHRLPTSPHHVTMLPRAHNGGAGPGNREIRRVRHDIGLGIEGFSVKQERGRREAAPGGRSLARCMGSIRSTKIETRQPQ